MLQLGYLFDSTLSLPNRLQTDWLKVQKDSFFKKKYFHRNERKHQVHFTGEVGKQTHKKLEQWRTHERLRIRVSLKTSKSFSFFAQFSPNFLTDFDTNPISWPNKHTKYYPKKTALKKLQWSKFFLMFTHTAEWTQTEVTLRQQFFAWKRVLLYLCLDSIEIHGQLCVDAHLRV